MQIGDIVTTPIVGDVLKVEVIAQANTTETLPNFGTVALEEGEYAWTVASGESGTARRRARAVAEAAQAIRDHWKRTREASKQVPQKAIAYVPASVVEAVNRVREHFGERVENEFYSPNGEAILHYRVDSATGKGTIHIIPNQASDTLVLIVHTVPGHVQAGVPEAFVSNPMYNTASTLDWWASMPEPNPNACPACGNLIEDFGALSRFDNKTKICNLCGDAEAMGDFAGVKLLGPGLVDG